MKVYSYHKDHHSIVSWPPTMGAFRYLCAGSWSPRALWCTGEMTCAGGPWDHMRRPSRRLPVLPWHQPRRTSRPQPAPNPRAGRGTWSDPCSMSRKALYKCSHCSTLRPMFVQNIEWSSRCLSVPVLSPGAKRGGRRQSDPHQLPGHTITNSFLRPQKNEALWCSQGRVRFAHEHYCIFVYLCFFIDFPSFLPERCTVYVCMYTFIKA